MIDSFKNYINILLCLGIFITIIQLIMPKNNLRKYIYSLTGVIMIITIISPIVNLLENENIETSISQVLANFDNYKKEENNENSISTDDAVKKTMSQSIKEDIKNKLNLKGIDTKEVNVYLAEDYNIKKISVTIHNLEDSDLLFKDLNSIVKYINEEYGIEYSKIEVIEEGIK